MVVKHGQHQVPGYGMAAAKAQHAVAQVTEILRGRGVRVRFGIHPVAGRLPGHMNVPLYRSLYHLRRLISGAAS